MGRNPLRQKRSWVGTSRRESAAGVVAPPADQGDLRTIFVVESPLDTAMAPEHGSPHDLVLRSPADVVARSDGPQAITVYRLRW